jgi:N-methylhydantoinase A
VTELAHDMVATAYGTEADGAELARRYATMEDGARGWLDAQGRGVIDTRIEYWAEMRYLGQFFSIDILLPEAAVKAGDLAAIHRAYHAEYERLYSQADGKAEIEILELRLRIAGTLPSPVMDALAPTAATGTATPRAHRAVRFDGVSHPAAPVFRRDALPAGHRLPGPAIIEQDDTTILVPPGFVAETQRSGDIVMTREA